ncbi:MAG: V-type ATP synthase subunit F [Candidatus Thermoplasmatota archaeon]|nr:V-type ATP synthase subunit F [Candidatus Thermoplasmatota archaeon]
MKIAGICDQDTATGLRLAGVKELHVSNDDAVKLWNHLTDRDDIGIVILTEKIAEDLGQHLHDYRLRNSIPIILEIPDKKGRDKDHIDFVSHLIKKAVGIEIKDK